MGADAGQGGAGGSGGLVGVTVDTGKIATTGFASGGLVLQSIGGSGGDGANADGVFSAGGGRGGAAGDPGAVQLSLVNSSVMTVGEDSAAIVAQSIAAAAASVATPS